MNYWFLLIEEICNDEKTLLASAIASVLALSACTDNKPAAEQQTPAPAVAAKQGADATMANPLLTVSPLQYQAPQFDLIKVEHYLPAMEAGIIENAAEIETIANNTEAATFDNTIVALEKSGALLDRATSVFFNMTGTISNPEILKNSSDYGAKTGSTWRQH
ncbi:MAG: hypothetical protein U5L01_18290 [Rheinheimera sp.]|nr:hypothetical protein [Rheinheimera sp.]